jgi:hypothetical protein
MLSGFALAEVQDSTSANPLNYGTNKKLAFLYNNKKNSVSIIHGGWPNLLYRDGHSPHTTYVLCRSDSESRWKKLLHKPLKGLSHEILRVVFCLE